MKFKKIRKRHKGGCVGAIAYAAGLSLKLAETAEGWNYKRRKDVFDTGMVWPSPPGQTPWTLESFWNEVSAHHGRKDAVVGYSLVVALPLEIGDEARLRLVTNLADLIAQVHGVAVHWAIHRPRPVTRRELELNPHQHFVEEEDDKLHNGNWHAHLCITACSVGDKGKLGRKVEELDPVRASVLKIYTFARLFRYLWTILLNHERDRASSPAPRLSHRSLAARGIDRKPEPHLGPRLAHAVRTRGTLAVAARVPWFRRQYEVPRLQRKLHDALSELARRRNRRAELERERQDALMKDRQERDKANRKMLELLDARDSPPPVAPKPIRPGVTTDGQREQTEYDRLLDLMNGSVVAQPQGGKRNDRSLGDPPTPKARDFRRRPS